MRTDLDIKAVIADMDGVITQTAEIHAAAWKKMFDDYLKKRDGNSFKPLILYDDYKTFIDGKPRADGIRSFLKSRGITIPEGSQEDEEDTQTVHGLGILKNKIFLSLLKISGVKLYKDTIDILNIWKNRGIKLGAITSSKNGRYIMQQAQVLDMFEVLVDGIRSEELNLRGKPEPDIFIKAAEELGVERNQTMIIEDAISGVEGGRKGNFALVVGIARHGEDEELKKAGADIVVKELTEIKSIIPDIPSEKYFNDLPDALSRIKEIKNIIGNRRKAIFLDYDGTLTPIVSHPDKAVLTDQNRKLLSALADEITIAVVSGRDRADVKEKIRLESIYYAGSHGFDITGPNKIEMEYEEGKKIIPELDKAENNLKEELKDINGVLVERKKYAIAVHYRNVAESDVNAVKNAVQQELKRRKSLREGKGKKVLELKPDIEWHKGKAIHWLQEAIGIDTKNCFSIYIGDDITDEDAFRTIKDKGIGILVGDHNSRTSASYRLNDTEMVYEFLKKLCIGED
jgi:trehalose 6-phosphate phosphatase